VLVAGLTGAAGSGKSTVAAGLAARGIVVLDADAAAHDLYVPGSELVRRLADRFGAGVLTADGGIDRAALGAIVFSDPRRRAELDALVHPPLLASLRDRLDALREKGERVAVVEAALLLRWGPPDFVDLVVGVIAPREARRRRLVAEGLSPEAAERRLDLQVDEAELERRADLLIRNDRHLIALEPEIEALARTLRQRAGTHP
jgi:dephospho-CoA kinase